MDNLCGRPLTFGDVGQIMELYKAEEKAKEIESLKEKIANGEVETKCIISEQYYISTCPHCGYESEPCDFERSSKEQITDEIGEQLICCSCGKPVRF